MKAFKMFIFGLLYGWLAKIAFDRIYRDNEIEDIRNENASLREYIHSLETKLQSKSVPQRAAPAEPVPTGSEKDDLKVIKGIGPAIEKKLNNAGIQTFAALARLNVEELEQILGGTRRLASEEDLIAQAEALARQK
jgi:predicted flap endonuclease-1-like 5' DNA nuclease